MVQVHLVTADRQTVIYTVDVPADTDGRPKPRVVECEGAYFAEPVYPPLTALTEYALVPGYVVQRRASFLSE